MIQHLKVFLEVRGQELETLFKVRPHQVQVQRDNNFPGPTGIDMLSSFTV